MTTLHQHHISTAEQAAKALFSGEPFKDPIGVEVVEMTDIMRALYTDGGLAASYNLVSGGLTLFLSGWEGKRMAAATLLCHVLHQYVPYTGYAVWPSALYRDALVLQHQGIDVKTGDRHRLYGGPALCNLDGEK